MNTCPSKTSSESATTNATTTNATLTTSERNAIICAHMRLVHNIARKVHRQICKKIELAELEGWGYTGLLESVDRFIPDGEARFSTFAAYRIRGAMLDGLGDLAPVTRCAYRSTKRGDTCWEQSYQIGVEFVACEETANPEEDAQCNQRTSFLKKALERLPKDQQQLLKRHYWNHETLREVGADLGISRSWACRSHERALRSLRNYYRRCDMDSLLDA